MTEASMSDAELVRRLGAHPDLRSRMESLLLAVEDETGELKIADAAEMRVIEEMRCTGQVALQSWATRQVVQPSQELKQTAGVWSEGKKNSAGTPPLVTSALTSLNTATPPKESARLRKAPKSATAAAHVWMLQVDGLMMDMRQAPVELQQLAFDKGLIPFVPGGKASESQ